MKRLVVLVTLLFVVVACGSTPQPAISPFKSPPVSVLPTSTMLPTTATTGPAPSDTPSLVPWPTVTIISSVTPVQIGKVKIALRAFTIPEIPVSILVPYNYTLVKNEEPNRRGSFVSYNFSQTLIISPSQNSYYPSEPPYFQEIQFFSKESIGQFLDMMAKCPVKPECFEGDYPDLTRYYGQKNALEQLNNYHEPYQNYVLQKFGDRYYLVSSTRCIGAPCAGRIYTTYLNDIRVDIWITMKDVSQADLSDELFSSFKISK